MVVVANISPSLIAVTASYQSARGQVCFSSSDTLMWQPAKASTFVLPVMEIEALIDRLYKVRDNSTGTDMSAIQKQINNWRTVLINYQAYNVDTAAMFATETLQYSAMVTSFDNWRNGLITDTEYVSVVDSTIGAGSFSAFRSAFSGSLYQLQSLCGGVLPSYQNEYLGTVCRDFESSQWNSFFGAITGACALPSGPNSANPLSQSGAIAQLCQQRVASFAGDLPKQALATSGADSMFEFLNDSTKFITFGASSPLKMSWTSTVSDSATTVSGLDLQEASAFSAAGANAYTVSAGALSFLEDLSVGKEFSLSLGRSSSSSHSYERTVSITLDDNDVGKLY